MDLVSFNLLICDKMFCLVSSLEMLQTLYYTLLQNQYNLKTLMKYYKFTWLKDKTALRWCKCYLLCQFLCIYHNVLSSVVWSTKNTTDNMVCYGDLLILVKCVPANVSTYTAADLCYSPANSTGWSDPGQIVTVTMTG